MGQPSCPAVPHGPSVRHVLLVDDHPDAIEVMALLLGLEGHDVRTARDGETALRLAGDCTPDLVVCDLTLPRLSGLDVARQLRDRRGTGARPRLVAMTGQVDPRLQLEALAAGYEAVLVKPFDPARLLALVAGEVDPDGRQVVCPTGS